MKAFTASILLVIGWVLPALNCSTKAAVRDETFDQEPAGWEGVNNRNTTFPVRTVTQNFGYSPSINHVDGKPGEVGGTINPAGEPAWYGYRLPQSLSWEQPASASGKLFVPSGRGHLLLGFFNPETLNGWRTPNTLVARINTRGEGFHCHVEYCTSRWRSGAGVVGEIIQGKRINAKLLPCGRVYNWRLEYDPQGAAGEGLITLFLDGDKATCVLAPGHRSDKAGFTHFGLLPVLKAWDHPGEVWLADLNLNGKAFDLRVDPLWEGFGNRRTYQTTDTRPRFDFGWSPTHFAGGVRPGELGGLVFRGDCREPARMAAYGDRLSTLTLNQPLFASGKVAMLRGVSDSTASIGFYNSISSMRTNAAQDQPIPMDYLGINIEGPSSEGFFFYPVYRVHGRIAGSLGSASAHPPRIYPDGTVHPWTLKYDPTAENGAGQITVTLDEQTCTLHLAPGARGVGASFDRFGICTPWIDGNSVRVFFDDLRYTLSPN